MSRLQARVSMRLPASKRWSFGVLGRYRDLRLDAGASCGFVARVNRAKIDQGIFFFGLGREARRPALFSPQAHVDAMVGADWHIRFDPVPSQHDVENPLHLNSFPGLWHRGCLFSRWDGSRIQVRRTDLLDSIGDRCSRHDRRDREGILCGRRKAPVR